MIAKSPISNDEKDILRDFVTAVETFKAIRSTMPLQYVTSFLLVAMEEGLSVTEYARRAGVTQNLMTRHLLDLGPENRHHEPGYGLVVQTVDPNDRRSNLTYLTPKGNGVLAQIVRALSRRRK